MLTRAVELHEEAAVEYDAAFDWYLARSPDAALKFDEEFDRALVEIAEAASPLGRRSPRYPQVLVAKVSFPFDLQGEDRRRNPDRGSRSH